jgi:hypothetical protein
MTSPSSDTGPKADSWCPSGLPNAPESVVLGVRSGPSGQVTYLAEPIPATAVAQAVPEGIPPTRVLRFASHCTASCANRIGTECGLINRVTVLPPTLETGSVPRCHLRPRCKWWEQKGVEACLRCPGVATIARENDEFGALVANPATTPEQLEKWIAESE